MIEEWIGENINAGDTIIHGGCRGVDMMANDIAAQRGDINIIQFNADWKRYGRGAGPIRNRKMLDEGNPDLVVGFTDNIEESKGTRNMLTQANARNIPTMIRSRLMYEPF